MWGQGSWKHGHSLGAPGASWAETRCQGQLVSSVSTNPRAGLSQPEPPFPLWSTLRHWEGTTYPSTVAMRLSEQLILKQPRQCPGRQGCHGPHFCPTDGMLTVDIWAPAEEGDFPEAFMP